MLYIVKPQNNLMSYVLRNYDPHFPDEKKIVSEKLGSLFKEVKFSLCSFYQTTLKLPAAYPLVGPSPTPA